MDRLGNAQVALAANLRAPPGTPLYVHVPFCAAKCHYCDFYSFAAVDTDSNGFTRRLLDEADRRAPERPDSVFIGGGTPSWLSAADLRDLLTGLERFTHFCASAREVTVECNPESTSREKVELLADLGVTRLSIGVQSLRPELLAAFGRVHGADDARRAFLAARAGGFRDVNVDLIYAAPGQRLADWEEDLRRIIDWGPTHISAYSLTFEPGTAFEHRRQSGLLHRLPEELELAFFESTHSILASNGYTTYEISNACLSGFACLHNLNYWANGNYVGLGPSAVSHVRGRRAGNLRLYSDWSRAVESGDGAAAWSEELSPRERLGETWWLGLRTRSGVDPARARLTAGFEDTVDPCLSVAQSLECQGLLVREHDRFSLSPRGLPLADALASRFLEARSAACEELPRGSA